MGHDHGRRGGRGGGGGGQQRYVPRGRNGLQVLILVLISHVSHKSSHIDFGDHRQPFALIFEAPAKQHRVVSV